MSSAYYYQPNRLEPRQNSWGIYLLLLVLFLIGAGLLVFSGVFKKHQNEALNDPTAVSREVTPRSDFDSEEKARIKLFKDIKESVVNVDTVYLQRDNYDLSIIERQQGTGSGFVWDKKGHIVTNFHVVMGALQRNRNLALRVTLADRSTYDATIIGASPDHDLAVLRIDADSDKLKPIPVGTSHDLEVGQTVYAIGNPFGKSLTLTQGIISALDREIESVTDKPITGVIQTDAALNPGNSGGPMLDKDGRLIGVNSAITSPTGGSVGIGYAIPVDTVNQIVPELIRTGKSLRPILGIVAIPDHERRRYQIDKGVLIAEVRPKGPADRAGLQGFRVNARGQRELGDIILAIKGEPLNSFSDLDRIMAKCRVQEKVKVTYQRGDEVLETELVLGGI